MAERLVSLISGGGITMLPGEERELLEARKYARKLSKRLNYGIT